MDKRKEVTPEKEAKPKTYIIKARQHGKSGWQLDEDTRAVEIAAMEYHRGSCFAR